MSNFLRLEVWGAVARQLQFGVNLNKIIYRANGEVFMYILYKHLLQDLQLQVCYALLDQVFHGNLPLEKSTTDTLADIQNTYYSLPHVTGTVSNDCLLQFFRIIFGF